MIVNRPSCQWNDFTGFPYTGEMHTSVLLADLVSAISFSGANQREGSIICESGGRGKGGGRIGFFY